LYVCSTVVLTFILLSAVVEDVMGVPLYGVDHRTAQASTDGTDLRVTYPRVTRGELDSSLTATIHRRGGFDGSLALEITTSFLNQFTVQRMIPEPVSETRSLDTVTMTFDQPPGEVFVVELDLATHPVGWFSSVVGRVRVVTASGDGDVSVDFRTDARP
jgi:hypothetical protein